MHPYTLIIFTTTLTLEHSSHPEKQHIYTTDLRRAPTSRAEAEGTVASAQGLPVGCVVVSKIPEALGILK